MSDSIDKVPKNGRLSPGSVALAAKAGSELSPGMGARPMEIHSRTQTRVRQAVLLMRNVPRYHKQTLGDLKYLVIDHSCVTGSIVTTSPKEGEDGAEGQGAVVGIAI
ncbi:MAG: hypothetical protein WBH10_02060 [Allopontixanthobacter sediminis]